MDISVKFTSIGSIDLENIDFKIFPQWDFMLRYCPVMVAILNFLSTKKYVHWMVVFQKFVGFFVCVGNWKFKMTTNTGQSISI
jgi:hypothetical protein